MKDQLLVSGANGFIASRLISSLERDGYSPRKLSRAADLSRHCYQTPRELSAGAFVEVCRDIECVIHCAGYAHALENNLRQQEIHWQVNYELTRCLAEAAASAGVRRFIFLSTVKAVADPGDDRVDEFFQAQPSTAYGLSKRAAENALLDIAARTSMEAVVLRPTMVYGKGGRGNLARMARWVSRGLFPPLPETGNHRSLIHVDDLIAAIKVSITHPAVIGVPLIVTSDEAPSGQQVYRAMAKVMGKKEVSWSVPDSMLKLAARGADFVSALTKLQLPWGTEVYERLLRSAWYSPNKFKELSGWEEKTGFESGLREMLR